MKTLLLALFLTFTITPSIAQDESDANQHKTFKGVPIDGTLNEFVLKMKKSGFTQLAIKDGIGLLKGDFAGYKNCIIGVSSLQQKDLVSKISVIFTEKDTWKSLASNYYNLKELLIEKYGDTSEVVEIFDTYSEPDDDSSKMLEVGMNNCKYHTIFETKNGSIHLSIENDGFSRSYVRLSYFDAINSQVIREKAKGDL